MTATALGRLSRSGASTAYPTKMAKPYSKIA